MVYFKFFFPVCCLQVPANKEESPGYYNHIPESLTESDEEPLLHTVPEKYRKVGLATFHPGVHRDTVKYDM